MAAVAVAGVASAQVTLTGKLSYGYSTSHSNKEASGSTTTNLGGAATAKDVAGFGVHDDHFTMTGSQDLSGGLSAAVSMEILSRGRGTDISGRKASLTVTGGFGSVMMGATEAGAPGVGLDGKVLEAPANTDTVKYTLSTVMEGLTLAASVGDAPGDTTGRSAGYTQTYGAGYASGALSAAYDYTAYKNNVDKDAVAGSILLKNSQTVDDYIATDVIPSGAVVLSPAAAAVKGKDTRSRFSVAYDFGVAKLGYGRQTISYVTASNKDQVQSTMGVSVSMGAITLGLATAKSQTDGSSTKTTGTDFGIKYELSKRTAVDFGRATWSTTGDSEKNKYQRIRLTHTF